MKDKLEVLIEWAEVRLKDYNRGIDLSLADFKREARHNAEESIYKLVIEKARAMLAEGEDKPCFHNCHLVKTLSDELADIKESFKKVMEEKCAKDEKHCPCVPVLRMEIKKLKENRK